MHNRAPEDALEFLLLSMGAFIISKGATGLRFEIERVKATKERPHGLAYSFTLHAPDGTRLVGFDNAHGVPAKASRSKPKPPASDHWHRTQSDLGRPYQFKNAEGLIDDFFDEVERVLGEHGIGMTVVEVEETRRAR